MKIKIKDLIEFSDYSDRRKNNFADRLRQGNNQIEEIEPEGGGGDYWVRCISAINKACRENDCSPIIEKINEIEGVKAQTTVKRTIDQYDRNLTILNNFIDYDFSDLFPDEFTILNKTIKQGEIVIEQFELKAKLHQVFVFQEDGIEKIGAILFAARIKRYSRSELGIFAELMFKLLEANYQDKFVISSENILAIDVMSTDTVNYSMIENGKISSQLTKTLNEIRDLL